MNTVPEIASDSLVRLVFAPGDNERLVGKVFDAVLLDLEDAVPQDRKGRAPGLSAEVAASRPCWVRVNRPFGDECGRDLEALAGTVLGFRVPKVESAAEVAWVADRARATRAMASSSS